jgi:hypothetical protein
MYRQIEKSTVVARDFNTSLSPSKGQKISKGKLLLNSISQLYAVIRIYKTQYHYLKDTSFCGEYEVQYCDNIEHKQS